METKPIVKKLKTVLWILAAILLLTLLVGFFVDYPKWLEQLLINILIFSSGLAFLYNAYQIRRSDRTFAFSYLIIGFVLLIVPFMSLAFVKIIAVVAIGFFLLTNQQVKKIINKRDDNSNS
jgi:chromate transport protein ChrA